MISMLTEHETTTENILFFANLHFFAEVIFWCEFYTFGAPFCDSGQVLGGHLKHIPHFGAGARAQKGTKMRLKRL